MKRMVGIMILVLLLSAIISASGSRPLSFEDFIRLKRLSDVRLSPRGDLVAFVVTEMSLEENRGNSDIWLMAADGAELRRLTSSPQADFAPRWSPDGRTLAFISTRNGSAQVWLIDPKGGEARPLTSVIMGVSGLLWSPDGKHLTFTSSVYPDCPDEDCNKKKGEDQAKSKVKARLYTELLYRHWNAWSDGTRSHLFIMPTTGGRAVDLTPGDFDTPPIALGGSQDYAFSADGTELCFVRNVDPELRKGLGTNNDLFLAPAQGGEIRTLTTNKANDNSPAYSPDARFLAYRAMARPGFEADRYALMLYDRKSRSFRNLTAELDYSVNEFAWSQDSSSLFFTAEEKGRSVVFRLVLPAAEAERVLEGHFLSDLNISADGQTLYFLKQAAHEPAEVYSYSLRTRKLTPLTRFNADILRGLALAPVEEFWFDGADHDNVHGFLVKPPSFSPDKKYPLVMLIHGGPQGAWQDGFHYRWNAQMFASPGYAVAMINFHGSTGYGQEFTDSISGRWGGLPYLDIMLGLDHLLSKHAWIDRTLLAAAGASYGGYMIDWIEGQTDRFRCLVSHSGVFDLRSMHGSTEELWFPEWEFRGTPWTNKEQYEKWSPSSFVANFKTPCLVVHGQLDYRVPLSQGLQFFTALQRMNVPSKLLTFPDEDHFVTKPQNARLWWATVLDWLGEYLKK